MNIYNIGLISQVQQEFIPSWCSYDMAALYHCSNVLLSRVFCIISIKSYYKINIHTKKYIILSFNILLYFYNMYLTALCTSLHYIPQCKLTLLTILCILSPNWTHQQLYIFVIYCTILPCNHCLCTVNNIF